MKAQRVIPWLFLGQLLLPRAISFAQPASPNRVLELDGQGSYVELPSAALLGLKEFTIEAWVKPAQFGRKADFLSAGSYGAETKTFILDLGQAAGAKEFAFDFRPVRNSPPRLWTTSSLWGGRSFAITIRRLPRES